MLKRSILLLAGVACFAGCQSADELGGKPSPNVSMQENSFFKETAVSNQAEIQSSQLALSQTQNPQVRHLAQHMIDDHTKAQQQLQQLAQSKGAMLPTQLDDTHREMADELAKNSGADFDRKYVEDQIKAHQMTIDEVQKEADNGHDADTQMLAQQLLPTLRSHLQMARDVQNSLMNGNARSGGM